jgi:hypothetical protein
MRFDVTALRQRWRSLSEGCALRNCSNTIFMRSMQSRVGVTVGDLWYCSVDCLVAALRSRYSVLSSAKVVDIRHAPRRPIGLLLLSKGFITEEQLRAATKESEFRGEELEPTLTRLGVATDSQMAIARAAQWGCPVFAPTQSNLHLETNIPVSLMRAYSAVPLHHSASSRRIVVGFCKYIDYEFLRSIEEMTGVRPEACFITPDQFADQLSRLATPPHWEEIVMDADDTPEQMANRTGRLALELGVRNACICRCRDLIWTRLSGRRGIADLLYKTRAARSSVLANAAWETKMSSRG